MTGKAPQISKLKFGSFEFDPRRHELRRNGFRIKLAASQLRLLTLFLERDGELVTREQITARLWMDTRNIDVSTGINTAINRLRRHLQETPGAPSCIETVIGLGYRFVSNLEQVELTEGELKEAPVPLEEVPEFEDVAEPGLHLSGPGTRELKETEEVRPEVSGEPHPTEGQAIFQVEHSAASRPTRWVRAVALCSLVMLLALLGFSLLRRPFDATKKSSAATAPSAAQPPLIRVTADEDQGGLTAAAVEPNGESVAYANHFGVSVHWFASGTERLLGVRPSFTVDRLAWLPNGNGLLMSGTDEVLHRQQVWFVPLQGAYLSLLAQDADRATVSPEGSLMAFTRNKDQELWLADTDGQHTRLLRSAKAGESFDLVLWSPAGNRLMVTLRKGLKAGTAGTTPLVEPHGPGAFECIDSASGQVLTREEGFSAESGYLLPDGRFYFAINETPGPTTGLADLMMVEVDPASGRFRGTPRLVRRFGARHAASLTASSTGARFAAILDRAETDVFVAGLRQSGLEFADVVRLTRGGGQNFPHSWTADAKGVLFESDALRNGVSTKWAIYNQPLDGSKPALIASLPESAAMAQLSPDGRWILFLEFTGRPQHASGIFRIPAAGGKIEQVSTHGNIEEFHCSASSSGRCILREANGNEALVYYELDPVHGMGRELGRTGWQPNRLGDWGLSADGTTVAAASHDTQHPSISLVRLGTELTQMRTIAVPGHGTTLGAMWAINGQLLFVECRTEAGFELVSLDLAGHIKLLRTSSSLIWAVPSRDGKKVAFPSLTLSSSVWASTVP